MLADNPGTWMFHCHVNDHMEGGMMATFTIYKPPTRSCPIHFVGAQFWNSGPTYTLTVKNTSGKKIKGYNLTFEHFIAPELLNHPYIDTWNSDQPLDPNHEQTIEMKAYRGSERSHTRLGADADKSLVRRRHLVDPAGTGRMFRSFLEGCRPS